MENKTQQNQGQGFAIASLVIGIFALLFSIIPCVGVSAILLGIVAIVFGIVGLTRPNMISGSKGMSIAGISLGGVAIFVAIFWLIFVVGSKSILQDRFEHIFKWTEQFDDSNADWDDEKMESLENLEKALDELEGAIDSTGKTVNEAVEGGNIEVKQAIEDARQEINDAKSAKKTENKKEN